jgi:hypothetical protein
MRSIVLTIICLVLAMIASAQEKKILNGFDGGMMVHTGLGSPAQPDRMLSQKPDD